MTIYNVYVPSGLRWGSARRWIYQFRGTNGTEERCCSWFGQCKSGHRIPSSKTKQHEEHMKENANGKKVENVLYHQALAVIPSPSLLPRWQATHPRCCWRTQEVTAWTALRWQRHEKDRNVTSSSHNDLLPSNWWQWNPPQDTDSEPKDRGRHFLKASPQESQIEKGVLNKLPIIPTAQIVALSVNQQVRPTRNSNKGHRTTQRSHNWPKHWQFVRGIVGETVWHGHGNTTKVVLLPLPYECPQCGTTLFEFQTVQMVSLGPPNHAWMNSGQPSG